MSAEKRVVPDWFSQVKPVCLSAKTSLPTPVISEEQKRINEGFVAVADENKKRGWSND